MYRTPGGRAHMSRKADMHRRCLARWLTEWMLDRRLAAEDRESDGKDDVVHTMRPICHKPHIATTLEAGHIWLIRPVPGSPVAMRPIYVAILSVQPDDTCLVAPFSRFAEPAVPGELSTGAKSLPLRVVCLWNARIMTGAMILSGWRGSRFSTRQLEKAREIHRRVISGMSHDSMVNARVGAPLRHPLDPRWVYLAEETEAFEESLRAVEKWLAVGANAAPTSLHSYDQERSVLPLAAESRAPYGKSRSRKRTK